MGLIDFLRIAEYANANWKGNFTQEEVKANADTYYADFLWSKENETISESIKTLCKNLSDDIREMPDLIKPKHWLYKIAKELNLIDVNYADYLKIYIRR